MGVKKEDANPIGVIVMLSGMMVALWFLRDTILGIFFYVGCLAYPYGLNELLREHYQGYRKFTDKIPRAMGRMGDLWCKFEESRFFPVVRFIGYLITGVFVVLFWVFFLGYLYSIFFGS